MPRLLAALILLTCSLPAAPLRILTIGDSLTEEYAFEFPFTSPATGQPANHARNWPELLSAARPAEVTFGSYSPNLGAYSDFRDGGYRLNFGVPGYTTENWLRVIRTESYNPFTDPIEELGYWRTRNALVDNLPLADVVVVFLGGNDLKGDYNDLYNDTELPWFLATIQLNLEAIHDFVRQHRPGVPVVVATLPDVGATPEVAGSYHDPDRAAATRDKIAAFNRHLANVFATRPATAVARIDRLTDRIRDLDPFHLNGTIFTVAGSAANPPDRVFCKDDFHPNTVGQALIANEIIAAVNSLGLGPLTPFADREILSALLFLDPDQPYRDFIDASPLAADGPADDPDADGLPNLVEMALGTPPDQANAVIAGGGPAGWTWRPDPAALRYLDLEALESTDLDVWSPPPVDRVTHAEGTVTVAPPAGATRHFLRLRATPRP